MGSVVNSAFDPGDYNSDADVELGIGISPGDFTAKLFLIEEEEDTYTNLWASWKLGGFTLAAEYVDRDLDTGADGDGYMAMMNCAKGFFGFTVRLGAYQIEDTFDPDRNHQRHAVAQLQDRRQAVDRDGIQNG